MSEENKISCQTLQPLPPQPLGAPNKCSLTMLGQTAYSDFPCNVCIYNKSKVSLVPRGNDGCMWRQVSTFQKFSPLRGGKQYFGWGKLKDEVFLNPNASSSMTIGFV